MVCYTETGTSSVRRDKRRQCPTISHAAHHAVYALRTEYADW